MPRVPGGVSQATAGALTHVSRLLSVAHEVLILVPDNPMVPDGAAYVFVFEPVPPPLL